MAYVRVCACVCVQVHLRAVYTHKSGVIRLTAANAPGGIYLRQTIQPLLKVPDSRAAPLTVACAALTNHYKVSRRLFLCLSSCPLSLPCKQEPCLISDKSDGKDNTRGSTNLLTSCALGCGVKKHVEKQTGSAVLRKLRA